MLISALIERFVVSCMRDFWDAILKWQTQSYQPNLPQQSKCKGMLLTTLYCTEIVCFSVIKQFQGDSPPNLNILRRLNWINISSTLHHVFTFIFVLTIYSVIYFWHSTGAFQVITVYSNAVGLPICKKGCLLAGLPLFMILLSLRKLWSGSFS